MKKKTRKVPQSVKVQRRIDSAVEQAVANKKRFYDGVIARREQKHLAEISTLKGQIQVEPLKFSIVQSQGLVVANWREGWKWFTVWGAATIAGINAFYAALPPEFIDALPEHTQSTINVIGGIALLLGRFINQSKLKALPPVENHDV